MEKKNNESSNMKKKLPLLEQFIAESRQEKMQDIEKFLAEFPDDATTWDKSTNEIAIIHNAVAEYIPGYKGNIFKSAGGTLPDEIKDNPGLRNRTHKMAIRSLLPQLSEQDFNSLYDYFKNWIEK